MLLQIQVKVLMGKMQTIVRLYRNIVKGVIRSLDCPICNIEILQMMKLRSCTIESDEKR